ncbi:MAG: pullulanase, type [Clostridiales bacterium]|nr:pullulanase, type [Clostridiales bacterium]
MYDYNLDGSVYKYEATMDASTSVYEAKVVLGKTWNGTDYGADGGNYKFTIPSKSTVIFETDLTATPKVLGAQITTLSFVNKAIDFNVDAVELDRREFKLTFENEVDLKSELVWYFYDAGDSLVNALIKKNAENPKEIIITLADGVVLQENSAYTIILEKGGIIETASQILSEEINIPFTTDSNVDPADIVKDTFVGLVSTDKYAVVGNFQQQDGETGNWIPDTDITVMKRLTGELYAYSTVLDAGNYEFKIVKNGNYDDPGSFAGGTGGYGNYVLTLSKRTKVNIYINAENRQIVTNVTIPNIHKYIPAVGPKLVGDIQSLFGETVWSPDSAKQVFYDYNLDGSDFRLERRILAGNYEAKAVLVAGSVSLWYGSEASSGGNLAVNLAKDMDVTFVIKGDYLSYAINVNEPKLAIDTFESAMIAGNNQQLSAKFTDEFNMVQDVAIGWSLKEPVAGVTISDTGLVTIAADVLAKTTFTVVASYDYNTSEFDTCNKLYSKEIIISVADVITNFKFNYLRYAGDYTGWNLWIWPDNQDGSGADVLSLVDGWYTGIVSIPQALEKLNFITRKGNWSDQEGGNRVFDLSKGNEVWLVEGDKTVYYSKEEAIAARLFYAVMDSDNKIDFKINGNGEGVDFSKFAVYVDGVRVTATSTKGNSTVTGIATLATPINPASQVEVRDLSGVYETKVVTMRNVLDKYFYYGNDLGFMSDGSTHTFKVWAPTAKKLSLSLYNDAGTYTAAGTVADHSSPNKLYTMIKDANTGVWTVSIPAQTAKYYMYKVEFADGTIDFAIDPYAKAVSANGQRAAIVDLDSTDPINWNPTLKPQTVTKDTDNILYELHIRDFSIDPDASFTNKGKYLAFTETGLKDSTGNTIGIDHLKELGITTVHLLPTYDFKTVNELTVNDPTSTDAKFNWGYDPQNYNVPEGSFSSDATNPNLRITEFKQMVQALHDANIRVVMDVVYNHTFDIDNGPFDKLVPGYYYRTDSNIEFTNGSGCGNEVASERPMVRKYIVESVKYWAKEYNIDGFRFDLFGLIDQDTINQVTRELKQEIDPTIMVYGEPWTGGSTPLTNGVNKGSQKDQGYAVFNDDLRGAIKGGSDDASTGFATGATGKELDVVRGIYGSTETIANAPTETINYLTAHDNLNLWDKVVKTQNLDETLKSLAGKIKDGVMLDKSSVDEAVAAATPYAQIDLNDIFANETVKRSVFANSIILTLQGVPFIHAGDEFLRTKYGDHNSYKSPDSINMIRWENKAKFKPVTDYYAGLMELRKTHPAFRMDTKVALINNIQVFKSDGNIVAYALKNYANGDTWKNVVIIYNANTGDQSVTIPSELGASEWKMVVNGSEAGVSTLNTIAGNTVSVPGLSMVVLYDEERAAYVPAATTIEIAQNIVTIEPNKEVIFDAIVKDQYGVVITNPTITSDTTDSTVVEYVNGKLISKAPGNATITIKSGDVSKTVAVSVYSLSATINPYNLTSNENGVIEISSTGINIKTITADLSAVGGTSKYNVNIITKKVAFGIKDYIGAGIKEIPITITDINNKTYVVKAIFELATIGVTDNFEWDEAVIYFMVTDRFNDGNTDNNGVLVDKTNPGMYHGGDFKGVTDKLDYLKDLGINTIWITPIVENITLDCDAAVDSEYYAYHGYWANDFTKLNPYLGTKAELETLIDEAHSRGMKLMVDVVINHAGYDTTNPDFIDMFRTTSGSDDETMSLAGLPDFKTEDQLVRSKVIEWQVAWAALTTANGNKIDYFRVDTAKHVDHETLIQFKAALTETNPAFKMIGEIWADEAKINSYLNNGQMDSAIDFGFNDIVSKFVVSGKLTEAEALLEARNVTISNVGTLGQFLSSHDENGYLVSTLGNDANKMMLAASLQITAKGQPVIYYGEEIGASGTSVWPDYDNRIDLDWSRADYSKVFAKGSRSNFAGSDAEGYLIFERSYEGKDLLVALNTRTTVKETTLTTSYEVGTKLKDIFNEDITYIVGADKKVNMIATLPIEITLQNKVEIESVRSAFTSLSVEQQLQVTNINVLIAAETKITELEKEKLAAEKLAAAILAAKNAINSLPTVETVAIANKQAVADAKALVAEVKALDANAIVEGEEKIALLEAKIAELLIPVPTTIEVEQVNISLERNDELAINIVVKDQFGNAITNPTITVESNSAVVEYLNGKLMAKSVGTATVTIKVGSISKEITVNVISKSSEADKNLENQIEELFYKVGVEFDNESNTITIKPLEGSQTGKIELSKQVIDTLNSNNLSLDVVTSNAIINVPASILKDIKTGSKIILDIKPSNDAVSGDGIAKVGNIVDINVFEVDGNNVSTQLTNFKALLTITIPVSNDDLAKVKNKLKLVVFYIDDEGNFTNMGGKLTDAGLEFTTNHLSKYVIVENHKSFIDVQGTWAQQYIEVLAARGIISGISADTFKPQATITRAEFAVLIAKTLGINDVAYTNEFSDVSKNAYYAQSIAIVSKQGIMVGNNGKFRPNDYITREEMTKVIIDAYAKIANIDLNTISTQGITSFEDKNKISTWALNYVNLAKVLKLINGTGENEFDPKSNLDRASASKVIFNLLEKVGKFN